MLKSRLAIALLAGTALGATGCGITYTSPSVQEAAGDVAVRVVPVTGESLAIANRSSYRPKSLPAAFYGNAGVGTRGVVGAGAFPDAPFFPDQQPEALELRAPPQVSQQPYRIGVGDVLLLATRGESNTVEQLSGLLAAQNRRQGYTVRDDGAIALPEIGAIDVSGLTIEEAENAVFQRLVDSQLDTSFSLEVAEFNSQRIVVGGAVGNATAVPIGLRMPNLGEAITASGGAQVPDTEFASIRIYRGGTIYQIPLETYLTRPDLQRLRLADGDAVYVDTTYDLDRAQRFYEQQINIIGLRRGARTAALAELETEVSLRRAALVESRATFNERLTLGAEKRDYVYLAGEVRNQSRVPLPYGQQASLADVLYDSGGFQTQTGDPSEIYVLRASTNPAEFGAVTAWHLNAGNVAKITLATRFEMRPNDVVFIREQPITAWGRSLAQIFPTLVNVGASGIVD
ncbi:MAG: polysaccharide biosynthesis/export family protein [Rhodobacteraceae bacterium]|nr:polysaccharide biosynthesis/export family protein [Paracoccaceae bacterium]